MKRNKWLIITIILIISLTTIACQFSFSLPKAEQEENTPITKPEQMAEPTMIVPESDPIITMPDYALMQDSLVSIYEEVSPGVVSIQIVSSVGNGQKPRFQYQHRQPFGQ